MQHIGQEGRVTITPPGHQCTDGRIDARGGQDAERSPLEVDSISRVTDGRCAFAVRQPRSDDLFRPVGKRDVIAVRFDEEFAVCARGELHPVGEHTDVLRIPVEDHGDVSWRMRCDLVLDELCRTVNRTIVGNDDFKRTVCLRECRLQRGADPLALVVAQ